MSHAETQPYRRAGHLCLKDRSVLPTHVITLLAKLSGAVYCNGSCLFVCGFICLFVGLLSR